MVAPTGRHHLFHPEGERATARGAAAAGALYVMSTSGATLVEDVAKERGGAPQWFQLYMQPDREATGALLDRCAKAGFTALVLTVDQPVPGWSPRAFRTPVIAREDVRSVNMVGQPIARTAYDPDRKGIVMFPTTWRDLEWLVKRCPLPVVVKGVLRGDDAVRCVDAGVKGHHGVEPRRPASRHDRHHGRGDRGDRRRGRHAAPRSMSTAASGAAPTC